jgi:inward rectifier potassium channel
MKVSHGRPDPFADVWLLDDVHDWVAAPHYKHPMFDLYHALMTMSWIRFVAWVSFLYLFSNVIFATTYLLCGDVIRNAEPGSFMDTFFFSVQTMATIGYGYMTPIGHMANMVVAVEAFFGIVYSALTTGLAFARFTRPTPGVRFSKVAVMGSHNHQPALKFRVANTRRTPILDAEIHLWLVREVLTAEGERYRRTVPLEMTRSHSPVFSLSWTAVHLIDEDSPLSQINFEDLQERNWQLLVTLAGYHESFSHHVYARHVYRVNDIQFGARLAEIMHTLPDGTVAMDMRRFDRWEPAVLPPRPHHL